MATEADDEPGLALVHGVDQVTDVQTLDGTGGTTQQPFVPRGKGDGGAMPALPHPGGEDTDHPLVPAGLEQAEGGGQTAGL